MHKPAKNSSTRHRALSSREMVGAKRKTAAQKDQTTTLLLVDVSDSSCQEGIVDSKVDSGEDDGLVGPQSGALVDRPGVAAAKLHFLARP
jgi:hypothetical protein